MWLRGLMWPRGAEEETDVSVFMNYKSWLIYWSLSSLTSLISLILEPPFPIREPHWLAGMTSRSVTGGLLLTVPLATKTDRSWQEITRDQLRNNPTTARPKAKLWVCFRGTWNLCRTTRLGAINTTTVFVTEGILFQTRPSAPPRRSSLCFCFSSE